MTGILFISDSRESIPLAYRLRQEGINAEIYIHDATYRGNFDGIMPRLSLGGLKPALKRCDTVIVDITLPNHRKAHDIALQSMFGLKSTSPGVFGPLSDKLQRTHQVIGGNSWCEHIELDREAGFKLAERIGLKVPEYQKFKGLKAGIKFLEANGKNKWVFKLLNNGPLDLTYPETFDGELIDLLQTTVPVRLEKEKLNPEQAEFILQEFVDGVEVSSELWWDGDEFVSPNRTIEDKKLGSGNTGPATGSQSNTVWISPDMDGPVHKEMQKLSPYLKSAGYEGCIDANCIIGEDGSAWFLEWTPRFGWSALYCLCEFIPQGQLSSFLLNGFEAVFKPGFVASQLISLWPYPDLDKNKLTMNVKDNLINHPLNLAGMYWQDIYQDDDNHLRCSGADGIIGIMTAQDESLDGAIEKCHQRIKKLEISGNVQYRTEYDHLTRHEKRYKALKKVGAL